MISIPERCPICHSAEIVLLEDPFAGEGIECFGLCAGTVYSADDVISITDSIETEDLNFQSLVDAGPAPASSEDSEEPDWEDPSLWWVHSYNVMPRKEM